MSLSPQGPSHAFSRHPKLQPASKALLAALGGWNILNQWLQRHPMPLVILHVHPWTCQANPHQSLQGKACPQVPPHQHLPSPDVVFLHSIMGKEKLQLLVHHFQCERHRYTAVGISAALPLTPEKRITFKNGNLIKNHK